MTPYTPDPAPTTVAEIWFQVEDGGQQVTVFWTPSVSAWPPLEHYLLEWSRDVTFTTGESAAAVLCCRLS